MNHAAMYKAFAIAIMAGCWMAAPAILVGQSGAPAANALNVPAGTTFVAKLMTNLDAAQNHVGDSVQAQLTRDVKEGKQTVLKKGSAITGKVVVAQPYSTEKGMAQIGIVFDEVAAKDGPQYSTRLGLRALAPAPDDKAPDTVMDGRGRAATDTTSVVRGGMNAGGANGGELTPTSEGVYGLRGLNLAFDKESGKLISVITATGANLRLKSGYQVVFQVSAQ
jgi:hypothetical protein